MTSQVKKPDLTLLKSLSSPFPKLSFPFFPKVSTLLTSDSIDSFSELRFTPRFVGIPRQGFQRLQECADGLSRPGWVCTQSPGQFSSATSHPVPFSLQGPWWHQRTGDSSKADSGNRCGSCLPPAQSPSPGSAIGSATRL